MTLGVGGASLTFLALLALSIFWQGRIYLLMPLVLGLMGVFYVLMFGGLFWHWRQQKRRVPVGEGLTGVPQFRVVASLRREVAYGAEEGLLSFVDGWLVFSGRSLSFSVRTGDVVLDIDDGGTTFAFAGPHGPHRAVLMPLGNTKEMREAWAAWKRAGGEPDGVPLYPPVLPSPVRRDSPAWRFYVAFLVAMGLLSFRALPVVGALEIAVAGLVLYGDLSGRAALRRIESGEPPRRKGLRGAYWSLRQGEPLQTVVHRALGRAERALR